MGSLIFPLVLLASVFCVVRSDFVEVGSFNFSQGPAFLMTVGPDLFITSFSGDPLVSGSIWRVPNIRRALNGDVSAIKPQNVVGGLLWPNLMTPSPINGTLFIFGDGFLPPGKSTGSLSIVTTEYYTFSLTNAQSGFFYHRGLFFDVNNDGLPDIITARGRKSLFSSQGQLIWLENPGTGFKTPWTEHVLANGPDVDFDIQPIGPGAFRLFAAEFFNEQLVEFVVQKGEVVSTNVIDKSIGKVYTVRLWGNDLYVSNYEYSGTGSVFHYRYTGTAGSYAKSVVSSAFKNRQFMIGSGAPGWVTPHLPVFGATGGTPNLAVCGDGAETFTLLSSTSSSTWTTTFSKYYASTIGFALQGAWGPTNTTQFLVSDYDHGIVHYYTYK